MEPPKPTTITTTTGGIPKDPGGATTPPEGEDRTGEAAGGVARGVSRSVRGPLIGRLPVASNAGGGGLLPQSVPFQRVARVSDRVSTGWDWYASAVESSEDAAESGSSHKEHKPAAAARSNSLWGRVGSFGFLLAKNTLLGMAVFETYGLAIGRWAPAVQHPSSHHHRAAIDDETDGEVGQPDDGYARASVPLHFAAGCAAGSVHGIFSSVLEFGENRRRWSRYASLQVLHHGLAHSVLFGSYEGFKRALLLRHAADDGSSNHHGYDYLASLALAGGLAGQAQHLVGFWAEPRLGLSDGSLVPKPIQPRPPPLRPLLWAFPPSAVGFVAFEYGKTLATTTSAPTHDDPLPHA